MIQTKMKIFNILLSIAFSTASFMLLLMRVPMLVGFISFIYVRCIHPILCLCCVSLFTVLGGYLKYLDPIINLVESYYFLASILCAFLVFRFSILFGVLEFILYLYLMWNSHWLYYLFELWELNCVRWAAHPNVHLSDVLIVCYAPVLVVATQSRSYSLMNGIKGKMLDVKKGKYGWFTFYSSDDYVLISPEVLESELRRFFVYYREIFGFGRGAKRFFAFMFKIKFSDGELRSCSFVQVSHINDFNNLLSTLSHIFLREKFFEGASGDERKDFFVDNLPKGNVVFHFKPMIRIKGTKYEKFLALEEKYEAKKFQWDREPIEFFKYNGFYIPTNMDLYNWPNITFVGNDYHTAFVSYKSPGKGRRFGNAVNFVISVKETSYDVVVWQEEKVLFSFTDESTNNNVDLYTFKRTVYENNGVERYYFFKDGKIDCFLYDSYTHTISFIQPLVKPEIKEPKMLTLDLETKVIERSHQKTMIPVCMSVYSYSESGKEIKFSWLFDPNNWQKDMKNALATLRRWKYSGYKIYVHNFSHFDAVFMIDVLASLGELRPIVRDDRFLKLTLHFDGGERCNIVFKDSVLLLPDSLHNLSKSFSVAHEKIHFPLFFLNRHDFDINYAGLVPDYKYFPNAYSEKFTMDDYNKYCQSYSGKIWNLKNELLKYCLNDTVALYEVLLKFREEINKLFNIDITDYATLPSLTFAIWRTIFLKGAKVPIILGKLHYILKQSYYGGITEVYKGFGLNINSYDVNSLYPSSMHEFDMPTGVPKYFSGNILEYMSNPFGFFRVKVSAPLDINKPFLPHKIKTEGGLRTIFPNGTWEGWYFSEEIFNAQKYGYRFDILEGYLFERQKIFKEYIDVLYSMKSNSDSSDPRYYIAKLLMNSLYGRFGLNPFTDILKIVSSDESEDIIYKEKNVKVTPLPISGKVMISYIRDDEEDVEISNISVVISSAIASYSRIHMSYFLEKYDRHIYSIDTDGIKLNTTLLPDEVDKKELGKMKFEYSFVEAAFPAPKVYGGKLSKPYKKHEKELVRVKGLKNPAPYLALKWALNKNSNIKFNQDKWRRDIKHSNIIVSNEPYTLGVTENKREIIYDSLGNFIDSIPLYLEEGNVVKRNPAILYYLNAPSTPILPLLMAPPPRPLLKAPQNTIMRTKSKNKLKTIAWTVGFTLYAYYHDFLINIGVNS